MTVGDVVAAFVCVAIVCVLTVFVFWPRGYKPKGNVYLHVLGVTIPLVRYCNTVSRK